METMKTFVSPRRFREILETLCQRKGLLFTDSVTITENRSTPLGTFDRKEYHSEVQGQGKIAYVLTQSEEELRRAEGGYGRYCSSLDIKNGSTSRAIDSVYGWEAARTSGDDESGSSDKETRLLHNDPFVRELYDELKRIAA